MMDFYFPVVFMSAVALTGLKKGTGSQLK